MKRPAHSRHQENLWKTLIHVVQFLLLAPAVLLFLTSFSFFPAKVDAAAGINKQINFQGKLVDNNGLNVADNTYTVVFSLYNVSSGGSATWTESDSVTTSNGIFQVPLGAVTTLPGSVDFNSDTWYLGIKVGADAEMTPRVRLTAVPYAFNAFQINGLSVTNNGGNTLNIAANKTLTASDTTTIGTNSITLGGGEVLTFTASNALTLTTTGSTNVTLPTSGLLVNTGVTSLSSLTTVGSLVSGTVLGSDTFTTNNILDSGALTIKSASGNALTLDTNGGTAAVNIGNTNATSLVIGNTANTATLTLNTSATSGTGLTYTANTVNTGTAFALSDTGLTSGTAVQVTAGDPKINNNAGTLTSGKLINFSSTNHSYMTLDNRDLTIGGHENQITLANIQDVYVYDSTKDVDGNRWGSDSRAVASSWYNETGSAASAAPVTGAACVIGTNTRCGSAAFPDKAIIILAGAAGANTLYIFDAKDNSLWMSFTQNAGATVALGVNVNNTLSSVFAYNGSIYIATNGSAATGMYELNFKTDKITRYNATDARDYSGNMSTRNTAQTTAYPNQNRTGMALISSTVNDVYSQVIGGKTYIAAATGGGTNGGISLVNETSQSVANLGTASKAYQAVWYSADDNVYGLNSTDAELDVWYAGSTKSGNTVAKSTFYDETTKPALWPSAVTINTGAPDALYVVNGTSTTDGQSNTIYVGHNAGLSVIQEKNGDEVNGSVKYYTSNMISEDIVGDGRAMLPMAGSGTVATGTTITKGTDGDASVKQVDFTTKGTNGVTHSSGVRGTGMTFDGTNYLCTGTTGTCANNANVDVTTNTFSLGFWIKTASVSKVLVDKQVTAGTTAGYEVQITAGGAIQSTATDGTTAINATSTRAINDGLWHHIVMVENRNISGSACNAGGNSCTITNYIDGVVDGSGTSAVQSGSMTNATQLALMATSAGATFTTGSMDEFFFTASVLSASEIQHMYQVGARALSNPNHAGSVTIRGVSVAADAANKINASSVVKAVRGATAAGNIYLGTTGGVSVIGQLSDTLTDLYSTSITTKDDIGTSYDATNGNAVNTLSAAQGYGTGTILTIGFNNAGVGGTWMESGATSLKDFTVTNYNPFGSDLTQTNLNVDRVLRVTTQAASNLDDSAITGATQPIVADLFKVDSTGAVLNVPTEALNTNTSLTNTYSGLTIGALNNMTVNGAGGTSVFNGIAITTPNITQTAGTISANGQNITIGSITTGGTQNGIVITPSNSNAAGTETGLTIGNITAGAATENAIQVGTGWDSGLQFTGNGSTGVIGSDNATSANSNAITIQSGTTTTSGNTGALTLQTGNAGTGAGTSGGITIQTGTTATTGNNSGTITIQSGNATVSTGQAGGLTFDVGTSAGAGAPSINIGQSTNTPAKTITIGGTTQTGTITIGSSNATNTLNIANGSGATTLALANVQVGGAINIGTAQTSGTINIGGGAQTRTGNIIIGSTGQTSGVTQIIGGTGTGALGGTTSGIDIIPGTAGTINIGASGGAGTGAITLGSSSQSQTYNLGIGTGAKTAHIFDGSGANVLTIADTQTAGSLSIGNAMTSGTIAIGGGSAVRTANITIGSTGTTTGVLKLIGGTGTGALGGTTSGIDIIPGTAGTINIGASGGAGTGAITVGQSTASYALNLGLGVTAAGNTKSIHIGDTQNASTGVTAITIGLNNTSTGANTVTIKAGGSGRSQGLSTTLGFVASTTTAVCSSLATGTSPTAGTAYELIDCTGAPVQDYAEMYPTEASADYGDIVMTSDTVVEQYQTDGKGKVLYDQPKIPVAKLVKTTAAYAQNVIGVVSNNYGDFTSTGYDVLDSADHPMPVALNGRILVKVATDSQAIRPGDYVTTSNQIGRAMKATQPGEVIGKALASWNPNAGQDEVMIYVEQGYYNGLSGSAIASGLSGDSSSIGFISDTVDSHLGVAIENGNFVIKAADGSDGVVFDRNGNATFSGIITAKEIRADKISGLDILTSEIAALQNAPTPSATPSGDLSLNSLAVNGLATISADLRVKQDVIVEGMLHVVDTLLANNFVVNGLAEFFGKVVFHGDVAFEHTPTFTPDTAGYAVIHKGDSSVAITFSTPLIVTPVVNATRVAFVPSSAPIPSVDPLESLQQAIAGTNYSYIVTGITHAGFTILLSKPAESDVTFSWNALLIPSMTPVPATSFDTTHTQSVAGATSLSGAPTASGSGQ